MHLKRNNIEKFWPIPRKGKKFVALPSHNKKDSIPLVIVMRDLLKLVRNSKELKRAMHEKQVFVNDKLIHDTNYPICLFDIINLPNIGKNYKAVISENKKMVFEEVSDKETKSKILKVIGKKIIDSNTIQLNLMHGWNLISKEKVNTGDSVVINTKDLKLIKIIPLEKGNKAVVIKGKHTGINGKIEEIVERGGKKIAKISSNKGKLNVWVKNLIVIE